MSEPVFSYNFVLLSTNFCIGRYWNFVAKHALCVTVDLYALYTSTHTLVSVRFFSSLYYRCLPGTDVCHLS